MSRRGSTSLAAGQAAGSLRLKKERMAHKRRTTVPTFLSLCVC
jgi:hypothetical protein